MTLRWYLDRWFRPASFLIVTVASVLTGFRAAVSCQSPGIDPSYSFAFNYAAAHGERWGQEFISNRGPYAWLLYPVDAGDLTRRWLLVQALFVVGVGLVAATYASSASGSRVAKLLMALILTYTVHLALWEEWRWFGLFLLLFLLGLQRKDRRGLLTFGLASVLGGFFLLMKLTIGPGALLTLGAGCLLGRRAPAILSRSVVSVAGAAIGLVAGWVSLYGTTSGLGTYLAVGWSMVTGYSSAASLAFEGWQVPVAGYLAFFVLLSVWAVLLRHRRACLSLAGCAVPLFVTWKYSVVREDDHAKVLVLFGLVVVAVLITDSLTADRRWRAAPLLGGAVASLAVAWLNLAAVGSPVQSLRTALTQPLRLPGTRGLEALVRLTEYRAHMAQASEEALAPLVLPATERELIADSTVDVYPWESAYVAANHLNWANRPSPASFNAFAAVDRMNAAFFDSPRRPRRLIWHKTTTELLDTPGVTGIASIDGRHVFWDEPLTLVSILNHYELLNAGSVFLLAPRAEPRFIGRKHIETVMAPWGVWNPVPDTPGVVLAELHIQRPLWARVRSVLLREEEMSVDVRYRVRRARSGGWRGPIIHCRLFPDVAAGGLWISPFPRNAATLQALLSGGLPEDARIAEIRFWHGWGQTAGPDIRLSWLTLETRAAAEPGHTPVDSDEATH